MTDPYHPATLDELEELLNERILVEDHFVDFKKDPERGPGANKGLAKDLAAFSIDGGRIFIGVDEQARDSGNPPVVAALNLSGLKERTGRPDRHCDDPGTADPDSQDLHHSRSDTSDRDAGIDGELPADSTTAS